MNSSLEQILDKYKKILSISNEKVVYQLGTDKYEAELSWNEYSQTWIIFHREDITEFYFIHELGHIYFSRKITHCDDFAVDTEIKPGLDECLYPLINNLIDGLVDYNLSKFNEIYPILWKKYSEYFEKFNDFKDYVDEIDNLFDLLSLYKLLYIAYRFITREVHKKAFSSKIDQVLKYLKKSLLEFTPDISKEKLEKIESYLNKFKEVKDSNDLKEISIYISNVLLSTEFWDKKTLIKQIKLYFPSLSLKNKKNKNKGFPKLLYLDQNVWIKLARVHYGKEKDEDIERLVEKIARLVDSGKLIVPINLTNAHETQKLKDEKRRKRLAQFIISISRGYCFIPYVYLMDVEILNIIHRKLKKPEINIRKRAVGIGIFYLIATGRPPEIKGPLLTNSQRKIIKNAIEKEFATPIKVLNFMLGNLNQTEHDFNSTIQQIETLRKEYFKHLDKPFRNKLRIARYLSSMIAPRVAEKCIEYNLHPLEVFPIRPTYEELMDYFKHLPLLYTIHCLHVGMERDPGRSIRENDLADIASYSFAIPYCDYVIGERFFLSIAKSDKLDELYNTVILTLSEIKSIEQYLDDLLKK